MAVMNRERFNGPYIAVENLSQFQPNPLPQGIMYLKRHEDGEYAMAVFKCPCGCNVNISVETRPTAGESWDIEVDFNGNPTIHPSIQMIGRSCGSHFYIKKGLVQWL